MEKRIAFLGQLIEVGYGYGDNTTIKESSSKNGGELSCDFNSDGSGIGCGNSDNHNHHVMGEGTGTGISQKQFKRSRLWII